MKTIISILVLLVLFSVATVSAQDTSSNEEATENYKFGIGGGAGFATGYGLSFRYHPERFGAQLNFAPYKDSDSERYSLGLTLIYTIIESRISSLYLYQANHFFHSSEMGYVYDPNASFNSDLTRITETYINNGLGFGVEIIVAKRIGINLMAGYAFYENFQKINVTAETALYYKF